MVVRLYVVRFYMQCVQVIMFQRFKQFFCRIHLCNYTMIIKKEFITFFDFERTQRIFTFFSQCTCTVGGGTFIYFILFIYLVYCSLF
jgi:hypothetical protein